MRVKCWLGDCEYHSLTDDSCTREDIEIDENGCEDLILHTEVATEYQETFYKQMKSRKDGHKCRKECRGKRIELHGLVFFTQDDDRYGDGEVNLTEETSGFWCGQKKKLTKEKCDIIREKLKEITPVWDLPDMTVND